jgi:hypothetical protein
MSGVDGSERLQLEALIRHNCFFVDGPSKTLILFYNFSYSLDEMLKLLCVVLSFKSVTSNKTTALFLLRNTQPNLNGWTRKAKLTRKQRQKIQKRQGVWRIIEPGCENSRTLRRDSPSYRPLYMCSSSPSFLLQFLSDSRLLPHTKSKFFIRPSAWCTRDGARRRRDRDGLRFEPRSEALRRLQGREADRERAGVGRGCLHPAAPGRAGEDRGVQA